MDHRCLFARDRGPLAPFAAPGPAPAPDLRVTRLEFTSRGDRVPARLFETQAGTRGPLVVLVGDGSATDAPVARLARAGATLIVLDAPLLGGRASPKLTERLLDTTSGTKPLDHDSARLFIQFVTQGVADLRNAFDVAAELRGALPERCALLGVGLGGIAGAVFCAEDPRISCAALLGCGGGIGPASVDPIGHVGRIAPRPVLLVNGGRGDHTSRAHADALHVAAAEPKQVCWLDGDDADGAWAASFAFLDSELGLAG